jgi:hypothetical protein
MDMDGGRVEGTDGGTLIPGIRIFYLPSSSFHLPVFETQHLVPSLDLLLSGFHAILLPGRFDLPPVPHGRKDRRLKVKLTLELTRRSRNIIYYAHNVRLYKQEASDNPPGLPVFT